MTAAGAGEEAHLVAAARSGSEQAFARLVDLHQSSVRGFLRRLSGSHADADDLAQEAFLAAWSGLAGFRPGTGLRPWLCGIAYRKWLTHRRSQARRTGYEDRAGREPAEPSASPDARLDAATLLGALPPEQRAAVALCLAAEFSHAEASQALGLPLGTIKSHVARGRAKLLELMGHGDE